MPRCHNYRVKYCSDSVYGEFTIKRKIRCEASLFQNCEGIFGKLTGDTISDNVVEFRSVEKERKVIEAKLE